MARPTVVVDTGTMDLTDSQKYEISELELLYKEGLFSERHFEAEIYKIVGKHVPIVFGESDVIFNS